MAAVNNAGDSALGTLNAPLKEEKRKTSFPEHRELHQAVAAISELPKVLKMSIILNGIVAVCPDLGIGNKGNLPWHPVRLRNEFKHFRTMTVTPSVEGKKNVVIMGRKTWFSIPKKNRPLNDRINIVLSRECKAPPAGAHHLAEDFSSALRLVDTELADEADQVWVIGGSSLYKEMMESPGKRRLFVTRILKQFECDTFLPEISPDKFRLLPEFPGVPQELQEENGIQYRFEVYESSEP